MLIILIAYIVLTYCIRKSIFYLWLWVEPGVISRSENNIITLAALIWPVMLAGVVVFLIFYGHAHIMLRFLRRFRMAAQG